MRVSGVQILIQARERFRSLVFIRVIFQLICQSLLINFHAIGLIIHTSNQQSQGYKIQARRHIHNKINKTCKTNISQTSKQERFPNTHIDGWMVIKHHHDKNNVERSLTQ